MSDADPVSAQLRPLLHRQLAKLRTRYLWFGLAKALLWVALLVTLFFVLDRWLRLPTPVRLLHTIATVAVAGYAIVHFVRYPLSKRFTDVDLAQWLEHTYPDLHERLVSAVQLHATDDATLRNQSRAMIEQLYAETGERAKQLKLDALFDNRALRRVAGGAFLLAGALAFGAVLSPDSARTFALRHLGLDVDYPRDTHLIVELPPAGADLQRIDDPGVTELVLPAGADLHVSVLAKGVLPKEAFLDLRTLRDDERDNSNARSRSVPLTPRPGNRFRHVFRRLSGSFEFRARGGDDNKGDRLVIVRTVRPAQVATLNAAIVPPAYTRVARIDQTGGAIEALVGSQVELTVQATAPVESATMVFLEDGRRLELAPTTVQDDGGDAAAFIGSFTLQASDRYQIELVAKNGLRNPNPGTYPISALQDYAPVGRWLLPEDDNLMLLPNALLCLRLQARDDFGLASIDLRIERSGQQIFERQLLTAAPAVEGSQPQPILQMLPTEIFELEQLLGGEGTGEGLFLQLSMRDNREPEAAEADLPRRIVQIVDPPQLAGAIAKLFRRLREEVTRSHEIQLDRRTRLLDLISKIETGAQPNAGEYAQVLTSIEVGHGRIAGSIQRVHRGMMRAFDLHLWNRLEPSQHAQTVVELYREHAAQLREPVALDPTFYRDLVERRKASTLGAMETTLDPILSMIDLVDRLTQDDLPTVAKRLAEAQVARETDRKPLLDEVAKRQQRIVEALAQLLLRLEEWNDYQDLIQAVRAVRDSQREVQGRTKEAGGK